MALDEDLLLTPRFPINVVARRTGLSAHVIRAWERRYTAIQPERSGASRRMYSDWEIQRLVLLRQAVELGHRIGEIAQLSSDELRVLVGQEVVAGVEAAPRIPLSQNRLVEMAIDSARAMDSQSFSQVLLQATRSLSIPSLFDEFIMPLMELIGTHWQQGRLRVAHEHFVSSHLRSYLGDLLNASTLSTSASTIVVTTPMGQHHELGALISAIAAGRCGWRVIYLGPSMPAEEIAYATYAVKAKVLALSIVYPDDDPAIDNQLRRLKKSVDPDLPIFIGGEAAVAYRTTLISIGARTPISLNDFTTQLAEFRQ